MIATMNHAPFGFEGSRKRKTEKHFILFCSILWTKGSSGHARLLFGMA